MTCSKCHQYVTVFIKPVMSTEGTFLTGCEVICRLDKSLFAYHAVFPPHIRSQKKYVLFNRLNSTFRR